MRPGLIEANPFGRQWDAIGPAALEAMRRVGESGWSILGREVKAFESELAAYWRLPLVVGCASGLDAIEIALRALGIATGDKVLTTPLSAFATSLAIVRAGGVPLFVDVDASGTSTSSGRAHLARHPELRFASPSICSVMRSTRCARRLRDRFALAIVEDCAQAIGARAARDRPVGASASSPP